MATKYEVNIEITAGCDFFQSFFMANPDFTPTNLTGARVHAALAKHSKALDANEEGYKSSAILFDTSIPDASAGHYAIEMDSNKTYQLEEGKYVFSVVIVTEENQFIEATSGLAFVSTAFGIIRNQETDA